MWELILTEKHAFRVTLIDGRLVVETIRHKNILCVMLAAGKWGGAGSLAYQHAVGGWPLIACSQVAIVLRNLVDLDKIGGRIFHKNPTFELSIILDGGGWCALMGVCQPVFFV